MTIQHFTLSLGGRPLMGSTFFADFNFFMDLACQQLALYPIIYFQLQFTFTTYMIQARVSLSTTVRTTLIYLHVLI